MTVLTDIKNNQVIIIDIIKLLPSTKYEVHLSLLFPLTHFVNLLTRNIII